MPRVTTATGKKHKMPYLPTDVPPSKARKGKKASGKKKKMPMPSGMKGY